VTAKRFIPVAAPDLSGNEARYVQECLDSTWISSAGRFIAGFEAGFADFCGVGHAIATNSGTSALHLCLLGLGVGPGDEVIVPTLTYIATANVVRYCGATPVLADCEPLAMTIDVEDVARKVTARTKAVIAVHLYGQAADMVGLNQLAGERGIAVVEDAAEAHGARVAGRRVGSVGVCNAFSFFGNKILTTGEGGAVTTDDEELAGRIRIFRGQGMDPHRRYWFPVVGYNYRMTNVAAAIGVAQLEDIEGKINRRQEIKQGYDARLGEYPFVTTPKQPRWSSSVNWLYTVLLDVATAEHRDRVGALLADAGIETRPVFYPLHQMPSYFEPGGAYPVADSCARRGLSLPTYARLDDDDLDWVCQHLANAVTQVRRAVT
jgi:perosamine synthetase